MLEKMALDSALKVEKAVDASDSGSMTPEFAEDKNLDKPMDLKAADEVSFCGLNSLAGVGGELGRAAEGEAASLVSEISHAGAHVGAHLGAHLLPDFIDKAKEFVSDKLELSGDNPNNIENKDNELKQY